MNKKLLFICFSIIVSVLSCTSMEENLVLKTLESKESADLRSIEEVKDIAYSAKNGLEWVETRSSQEKSTIRSVDILGSVRTRGAEVSDTLVYVVNFDKGFVLVSAPRDKEAVLAVIENGQLDTNDKESPASFISELAVNFVKHSPSIITESKGPRPFVQIKLEHDTTFTWRLNKRVSLALGQTGIEAHYSPYYYPAGCSNIALAQIMSYFQHPTQLPITFPNAPTSILSLNWSAINQHGKLSECNIPNCTSTHYDIACLIRQLGHLSQSVYSINGTGTESEKSRRVIGNLGYSVSDWQSYNYSAVSTALSSNKLLYFIGDNTNGISSHAWVVDGGLSFNVHTREYILEDGTNFWRLYNDYGYSYYNYLHINWGHHGSCNGLFTQGLFKMNQAYRYDYNNSNSGSQTYNNIYYFTVSR